mmetsp:Transcript_35889/g.91712  ORF Transcript_35889/g.91712 Transcript_35889/m.91712 type:complete len:162 (+) Transcript_35889:2769-3254(+)
MMTDCLLSSQVWAVMVAVSVMKRVEPDLRRSPAAQSGWLPSSVKAPKMLVPTTVDVTSTATITNPRYTVCPSRTLVKPRGVKTGGSGSVELELELELLALELALLLELDELLRLELEKWLAAELDEELLSEELLLLDEMLLELSEELLLSEEPLLELLEDD